MKHGWSRDIPAPTGKDIDGRPTWTGKLLISMAIPKELNIERGKVKIYNGVLISGNLGKGLLGVGTGTLLHLVVQQLGEDRARNFLDNLHDVSITWLQHKGFTFGLRDISIPDKQRKEFHAILEEAEKEVADYLRQVTNPNNGELTVDADRVENTINQKLNQTISRAAKDVLPSLPRSNLSDMAIGSESKGKKSNITQMVGYVGQQNVNGARIPCGLTGRALPHFRRNDFGLRSRGWVKHCYEEGLDPQEFFLHAAGGREGLVDTAIKVTDFVFSHER
jgi:DNA-directed RNA polymerase beta' subunit